MELRATGTTSEACRGCGAATAVEALVPVAGVPFCAGCAPVAQDQHGRLQARREQEQRLAEHEADLLELHREREDKDRMLDGILRLEATGRRGLGLAGGAVDFGLWAASGSSELVLALFPGVLFADATAWVCRAFFEIRDGRARPFVELGIYMLLFHLWNTGGGHMPEDPTMRGAIWLVFGVVFVGKMTPWLLNRLHPGMLWGRNPYVDDRD
ncbi:MAG: hypothetical protein R3F30_16530 [Planctomycetota bacterium]